MTQSVSVVLPAYNAAGVGGSIVPGGSSTVGGSVAVGGNSTVGGSIARLRAELSYDPLEIIVVDDGSADGTAAEARQAGADLVIELPRNRGKGAAVKEGVLAANGEIVVFTDVDLSYGPEVIREAVKAVQDGALACVGQRKVDTGTAFRKIGSRLVKWRTRKLLGEDFDTQCGIKAFEGDLAKQIFSAVETDRFAFDIEVFLIMKVWGVRFETIDVVAEKRRTSTVRAWRDGFDTLRDSARIARRARKGAYERS